MKINNTTKKLLLLFATIFTIKAVISLFFSGTYFYSDEACVVIKAKALAESFKLLPCYLAAGAPAMDPLPLYSIIIAPLFFLFKGFTAYKAVLVFNSLAISSLVFPLYWIIKNFIKKDKIIILIITVTLFLPQITIYEKMLLTESFFIFINIWLLYFYGNYKTLKTKKGKFLALTILFAILAGLERPFGFIVSLSLLVNELITSKNKVKLFLIIFPIAILLFGVSYLVADNVNSIINSFLKIFTNFENFKLGIIALKNQINSLTVATLFIPIIVFATNFKEKSPEFFKQTKYYLLTLLVLNIGVSANHIYDYLITNNVTDLITRYINISIILLDLFFLIFIFKNKKFKLNFLNTIVTIICMIALVFFNANTVKQSLNIDLSIFYSIETSNAANLVVQNKLMEYLFFPITIFFFSLLLFEKRKIIISIFITTVLFLGLHLYYWNYNYSKGENIRIEKTYFRNTDLNLLIIQPEGTRVANFLFWDVKTLTKNRLDFKYLDVYKVRTYDVNFYTETKINELKKYDIILSQANLKLPIKELFSINMKAYYPPQGSSYEENLKILDSEGTKYIIPDSSATETPNP